MMTERSIEKILPAVPFPPASPFRKIPARLALAAAATIGAVIAGSTSQAASDGPDGGDGTRRPLSYAERVVEANRQLAGLRSGRPAGRTGSVLAGAPAGAGVRVDPSAVSGSTLFFYDDVESGVNGWTTSAEAGGDLWHRTSLDAASPSTSWWPGVDSTGDYATGTRVHGSAITPAVDLSGAAAPLTLLFAERFHTERGWDYCMVDISSDGGSSWTPLRGEYGTAPSGNTEGWRITTLDISAWAGDVVSVRFRFDTGDSLFNAFPGWFVDDVMIFDRGGTITGKKFFDVNNNGVKELHERGLPDWLITASGPVVLTDRTNYRGKYRLILPLGSYTVSETPQAGWSQTYPSGGTWSVTLATPDTIVDSIHFGNWRPASFVTGVKFHDLNRNGFQDAGDTLLPEWKVVLTDTHGVRVRFDRTDSLGVYSIPVYEPGTYRLHEQDREFWVQNYPPTETYTVTVPDVSSVLGGRDFGNYFSDSVNSIFGRKFEDLNRNGVSESHEPGVSGFVIRLAGAKNRKRITDDSGYYAFTGLPAGSYTVREEGKDGWWRSLPAPPDSAHAVVLAAGSYHDSVDFGNYQIAPSSISGVKWNDLDDNGVHDAGEPGIPNWKITLSGKATASVHTDASGAYSFSGLWPGDYTVSESWRTGWRQTWPPNLGSHGIWLGPEEDRTDVEFGNVADSLFSTSFRTFSPESLALGRDHKGKAKPVKPVPDKAEFAAVFVNAESLSVSVLRVRFDHSVRDSLTHDRPGILLMGHKNREAELTLAAPMAPGESLTVGGFTKKPVLQGIKWWRWTRSDLTEAPVQHGGTMTLNALRLPMPNTINLLSAVGAGLKVGLGGPHSVVHPNYKAVLKSLVERGDRFHLGVPRCIDRFEGTSLRPIRRQQKHLMPKKHNNMLLAEAIALRANIRAGDNLFTPAGFGDLVYDEGGGAAMPLNDLSVREIGGYLDKYMSSFADTGAGGECIMAPEFGGLDPDTLLDRIRKINRSFEGPLDTLAFSTALMFSGVRPIDSVDCLRFDTSSAMRPVAERDPIPAEVAERFELFQNYPNPFNPATTLEFYLPSDGVVSIAVYNTLGQVTEMLVDNERMEEGYREVEFDASAYSSGVYFYRLTVRPAAVEGEDALPPFAAVRKMVLVR